jgi:uncharacterized membrane protein
MKSDDVPRQSRHLYDREDDSFSYSILPYWLWLVLLVLGALMILIALLFKFGEPDLARRTLGVAVLIAASSVLYNGLT